MTRRLCVAAIALVAACSTRQPAGDTVTVLLDTATARRDTTPARHDTTPLPDSAVAGGIVAVDTTVPPADTVMAPATSDDLSILASSLIVPVQGVPVTQLRDSYADARTGHTHEALDIMAPRGTPVISATDGRLLKLFKSVAGGNMVYAADVSDHFILMYGHLDRYADGLVENTPIKRGQLLGYVGSTGDANAAAPHLHFAIARGHPSVAWWKGEAINPFPLFVR